MKKGLSGLKAKWKKLDNDERKGISLTVGVISTNVQKFASAQDNPVGAIQGAVEIIASVASNFGPMGQLVSMGLGFVSSLLGLFGKGPKPTPLSEVVRKQIDEALGKYRDHELTTKAKGLITALGESKAYLDGFASSGKQMNKGDVTLASTRVPVKEGGLFIGRLYHEIVGMLDKDNPDDAHKCLKYIELYVQIVVIRDMILTQYISMSSASDELKGDVLGLIGMRQMMRDGAKIVLQKLYKVRYDARILVYFDPDVNAATDSLARSMFNIGKYDRSLSGYCCLQYSNGKDLSWDRSWDQYKVGGKPFTMGYGASNNNCFWKLVPHGWNLYSIVNKYKCKEGYAWCGSMLSWDGASSSKQYVTIDHKDPVLWEINGYHFRR